MNSLEFFFCISFIITIKKLKKYVNESDIHGSLLRGEIVKQKHQNKQLVNALKELYDGNEELATKILANTFSAEAEMPTALQTEFSPAQIPITNNVIIIIIYL